MEYKTHFYSFGFLLIVFHFWPWSFESLIGRSCAPYTPPHQFEIRYPFKTYGECRRIVQQAEVSSKSDKKLTMVEEIQLQGYNISTLTILSDDGYFSTIYRVYGYANSSPRVGKQAILLFHGGFGASSSWIIQPGTRNLVFMLVEAGYEVWIANLRGTTPSQNHTNFNAENDLDYWRFNFEHIGTRDLPLFVDLILKETQTEKLYFACHSAGCLSYLIGLIEKPELNNKFKAGFLLAPVVYCGTSSSIPINIWAAIVGSPLEQILFKLLKGRISIEPNYIANYLGLTLEKICRWPTIRCGICDSLFFYLYGNNAMQFNYTDFTNMFAKLQDTYGLGLLSHGMQNYKTCSFQKFDYGEETNFLKYGSFHPPKYNLDWVAVPTYLFYGESDNMVTPVDMIKTRDAIPARYMRGFYRVNWPLFNHVDFLMAKDADVLVYTKILKLMNKLELQEI